ncbi:MAG: putative MOSC domain [Parcubacteria group bacterium Gr01-1014_38]|nr:MAG: putative MOSC domain [Parcubacteria group bacterium Gr01-1014_38]
MNGKVVAVCLSDKENVPKYPQPEAEIGPYGIVGDFHAGPTRISRRTGQPKFNDRQISLVAQEALDALNAELGITLKPGDLGENITTEGLGDLSDAQPGTRLRIGPSVILEVTEQNDPCKNLLVYHKLLVKKSYGKRGILAIVREGAEAKLRPGDSIVIL